MTGEDLYRRWTESLRAQWSEARSGAIFVSSFPRQPSSPPVAWPFLTDAERAAWDGLAEALRLLPSIAIEVVSMMPGDLPHGPLRRT